MSNVLLISYDNGSHLPLFPMNIFYLMGALKAKKHNVGIWFQDVHHQEDEYLNELLNQGYFDVVGIGFVAGYYPYKKVKRLSEIINSHENRNDIQFVLGGHGPAGAPEFFLNKFEADTVLVGDGEGLEWLDTDGVVNGTSGNDYPDLSCYEFFPIDVYRLNRTPLAERTDFCLSILSSRGCKWNCSFCYRMRKGFHERPVSAIMEEIRYLHKTFRINYFDFEDELLMGSEKRTGEICQSILNLPFKIRWDCNGRLNFAKPELMAMMKESGCGYVNYGIESLNQTILNQMGKGLTIDQIHTGVESTLKAGLSPGLNLLWGFPENTVEDLYEQVDFLEKYDPCHELRTIRPVTPYPGCPLFEKAVNDGLVKDAEDFYENKHVNSDLISVNFMDCTTEEAHKMLNWANFQLMQNFADKRMDENAKKCTSLYIDGNTNFRGWRAV